MKYLLIIALLFAMTAHAADINCPGGTCQGTSGNDTIIGTSGYDEIYPQAGNDIIDLKEGDDKLIVTSGDKIINTGTGNDIMLLAGPGLKTVDCTAGGNKSAAVNDIFGPSPAIINCGDGNDIIVTGVKSSTVHGGGGDDTIGTTILGAPAEDHYFDGGPGNDILTGGQAEDVIEGGSGDDLLKIAVGSPVMMGDSGDDVIWMGDGNSINYGGTGSDKFKLLIEGADHGDKEIFDFAQEDFLDFTFIPNLQLEDLACCISFVEEPPSLMAITAVKDRDKAIARRAAKKNLPNVREWKHFKTTSETVMAVLKQRQPNWKFDGKEFFAEMRRQLKNETRISSGGFFISDAMANPGPEVGDMLIADDSASILIKGGKELVMSGQFTVDNFIFAE